MANLKGINPANSGDANARAVEANVHRLDRSPSIANERPGTAEAEMPRPEDRKPEALPAGEPYGRQVAPSAPAPKKSTLRPQAELNGERLDLRFVDCVCRAGTALPAVGGTTENVCSRSVFRIFHPKPLFARRWRAMAFLNLIFAT